MTLRLADHPPYFPQIEPSFRQPNHLDGLAYPRRAPRGSMHLVMRGFEQGQCYLARYSEVSEPRVVDWVFSARAPLQLVLWLRTSNGYR